MSDIDHLLSAAVKAILLVDRPAGLSAAVTIRSQGEKEKVERPYLVIFCEDGSTPHPQLRQTTLVMRLRTRADEQESDHAAGWHAAAVGYFIANPAALHATLLPHGLELMKFVLGDPKDAPEEDRGREYDQRWSVWLRRVTAPVEE